MDDTAATGTTPTEIEAAFGGRWGVWLSETGRWRGARTQPSATDEVNAGCVPFVHAPGPIELTARLHEQDGLLATPPPGEGDADDTAGSGGNRDTSETMTLDDLRRIYAGRWTIAPITGGYRAEPSGADTPRLIPPYGRTPAELAKAIGRAETAQ